MKMMDLENIEMPFYTETAESGEKGVRMVSNAIEDELRWIFRPNIKTDIGIDGEIEIIKDDRKGTGKLIAVQIKCGMSFFEEQNEEGYIFRCRPSTMNYWLSLSIPVILCLCNPQTKKIFWCHITVETIKKLDKSYKVIVPYDNKMNKENEFKLEQVSDSVIQLEEIVDAAIFRYLYERYKNSILICPLMEEPHDFHNLSYIAEINKELYMIGSVIDKYGCLDFKELNEKIRLYHENRTSCGWSQFNTKSKLLICFVSESVENLKLSDEIEKILEDNVRDVEYCRLLLLKEYIRVSFLNEEDELVYFFNNDGSIE